MIRRQTEIAVHRMKSDETAMAGALVMAKNTVRYVGDTVETAPRIAGLPVLSGQVRRLSHQSMDR